ncbi:MAG TPA: GAF domain-containing protein, partial [Nitrospiria bacterium]|nr:GAF domain-containing protein [Nitrospiria bacterium]
MSKKEPKSSQKLAELTALYEISSALASSRDPGESAKRILEILASSLAMRRGTLTFLDPDTGELVIETAHGLTKEEQARGRFKIGEGVTGRVFERGEPMIVPDLGQEPLFLNRTRSRGDLAKEKIAFICMPVKVRGEVFGVLSVDRLFKAGSQNLDDDVRLLTVVASLIGQAVKIQRTLSLEKKQLEEQNI